MDPTNRRSGIQMHMHHTHTMVFSFFKFFGYFLESCFTEKTHSIHRELISGRRERDKDFSQLRKKDVYR